jgi:lysophospholipid acyltransferase (LPLAT)-like uncharacterized protein
MPMLNRLLRGEAVQRAGALVLGVYLSFALRTTRWALDGAENLDVISDAPGAIAAFWHECLPLMPALWARFHARNAQREAKVLISRHRDGRLIAEVLRHLHIGVVHGSSARPGPGKRDKGGSSGLRALLSALQAGDIVVVTPDGPRGPARVAAGGVAHLAALSGLPVLPCAGMLRHHIRLRSWDRMIVPLPFGRGTLVCLQPIMVSREGGEAATAQISAAMTAAIEQAEHLCR